MKSNLCKMIYGGFVSAVSFAVATLMVACSESGSNDKGVAGGTSEDAGIIAIKDLDVAGVSQKGPFVKGSAVTVQGIDCKTLNYTGEVFDGEVKSDKGDFAVDDVTLSASCAVFAVTGKYRSEITGKESVGEVTLHALTDLKDRKNVNINVLTELEYERVMHLVTVEGKKFEDAKVQAEKEVLAAFGIAGDFDNSEDLTIFESGDGNAALLAVSVLMLSKTDDAGLATRIDKFTDSFAETGKWNDVETKAVIENWQVAATADGTLDSIRKNVESWGYADVVPAFEKYIEAFGDTVILSSDSREESSSGSRQSSSSTPVEDLSSSSVTLAVPCKTETEDNCEYGTLTDERDGQTYKTVKIGDQVWMAENLNIAAPNSYCYHDSAEYCSKYGRLYNWAGAMDAEGKWSTNGVNCRYTGECSPTYPVRGACPEGWHLPDSTEWEKLLTAVGGLDVAAKMLKSASGWQDCEEENCNGTDAYGFSALPAGYMERYGSAYYEGVSTGFYTSTQVDKNDAYRVYMYRNNVVNFTSNIKAVGYSVRCVKDDGTAPESSSGVTPQSSSSSKVPEPVEGSSSSSVALVAPCKTETEDNCEYGTLTDFRDGQTYKTVKIGEQWWMAENLNYNFSVDSLGIGSYCYNDSAKYCEKYGALYTWAVAMDSAGLWSDDAKGCGYEAECSPKQPVQGICPAGWHMPDTTDWGVLRDILGENAGIMLKSQTAWYNDPQPGTDAVGFTALPGGLWYGILSEYEHESEAAYFWSTSSYKNIGVYYKSVGIDLHYLKTGLDYMKGRLSVRCLKN